MYVLKNVCFGDGIIYKNISPRLTILRDIKLWKTKRK